MISGLLSLPQPCPDLSCTCRQRVGRGLPGCTDIFREPLFLLLRPVPSQVPPKGLNTMCTAYFPFCSLLGRKPDSHFFFYFWQFHVACWILVPQQGFNPSLPLEAPNLNHRATREVPSRLLFLIKAIMLQGLVSGGPVTSELDPWQAGMSQRSDV